MNNITLLPNERLDKVNENITINYLLDKEENEGKKRNIFQK